MSISALPTSLQAWGKVTGRIIFAQADTAADGDDKPEARAATGQVIFTPSFTYQQVTDVDYPALVMREIVTSSLNSSGYLTDANGTAGIWLLAGVWTVSFNLTGGSIQSFDIEVTTGHTAIAPLDLAGSAPYEPPVGSVISVLPLPGGAVDGYHLFWDVDQLGWEAAGAGSSTLDGLTDVSTTGQAAGEALVSNGTTWAPSASPVVLDSRQVIAGTNMTGGGALTANVTLNVPTSSTTVVGAVELATSAETTTGTDTARATTPAGVQAVRDLLIPKSLVDAKGDILTATANDTPARLGVGTNGQVLTADSTQGTGIKWAAPSGGGATFVPSASGIYTPPPGWGCGPETTLGLSGADPGPYYHYYGPTWLAEASFRITAARVVVTSALASNTLRLGLVEMSSGDQPTALAGDWGTVSAATTGDKDITGLTTDVVAGKWYATVLVRYGGGGTVVVRAWPVPYGHMGQDSGTPNRINLGRQVLSSSSGPSTGLSNPPSNWTTALGAGSNGTPGPVEFIFVQRAAL